MVVECNFQIAYQSSMLYADIKDTTCAPRGAAMAHLCTDPRMARQASDACALALLSTSRNLPKALHGAAVYPTTSLSTWAHLARRPFASSRLRPRLRVPLHLHFICRQRWLHIHLPADARCRAFHPRPPASSAPSSTTHTQQPPRSTNKQSTAASSVL